MKKPQNFTKLFKGFRMGRVFTKKPDYNLLEKQTTITSAQVRAVEIQLEKCSYVTKEGNNNGNEKERLYLSAHPAHIARLAAILEKPLVEAKVHANGKDYVKPEPVEIPKEETK